MDNESISYKINTDISAMMVGEIYKSSGINHPTNLNHIQMMLDYAKVIITAWDEEKIVGFLKAFTDYCTIMQAYCVTSSNSLLDVACLCHFCRHVFVIGQVERIL